MGTDRSEGGTTSETNPGDEELPDEPDMRLSTCPNCGGTGHFASRPCETCGGSGKILKPIGGG